MVATVTRLAPFCFNILEHSSAVAPVVITSSINIILTLSILLCMLNDPTTLRSLASLLSPSCGSVLVIFSNKRGRYFILSNFAVFLANSAL